MGVTPYALTPDSFCYPLFFRCLSGSLCFLIGLYKCPLECIASVPTVRVENTPQRGLNSETFLSHFSVHYPTLVAPSLFVPSISSLLSSNLLPFLFSHFLSYLSI